MDISMWWTMTTLTGRCTLLVEVQAPPSIAKATDTLPLPILLQKRYPYYILYNSDLTLKRGWVRYIQCPPTVFLHEPFNFNKGFIYSYSYKYRFWVLMLSIGTEIIYIGYEEGGYWCKKMAWVELEIGRWPSSEWGLFHPIRSWSIGKLCESLQFGGKIVQHGW